MDPGSLLHIEKRTVFPAFFVWGPFYIPINHKDPAGISHMASIAASNNRPSILDEVSVRPFDVSKRPKIALPLSRTHCEGI
jgi:hypothetical protein